MSDTFSTRRRLPGALTVLLTAAAVVALLVVSRGVPDAWWPKTGNAFPTAAQVFPAAGVERSDTVAHAAATPRPASTRTSGDDPCDLIVGPAHDYCRQAPPGAEPDARAITVTSTFLLTPTLIGIVAFRLRNRRRA